MTCHWDQDNHRYQEEQPPTDPPNDFDAKP
jgi:hypothetical protein